MIVVAASEEVGKKLLSSGNVEPNILLQAGDLATRSGARLAATLVKLGLSDENDVAAAFASCGYVPFEPDAARSFSHPQDLNTRFLRRASVAVFGEREAPIVVMADPSDEGAKAALAFALEGEPVVPLVATFGQVDVLLGSVKDATEVELATDVGDLARLAEGDSEAPVIRLVQSLLAGAAARRASDVHIEPMARRLVVRYRIDGRLIEVEQLPASMAAAVASRIKVMAGLDIAETRLPQDGRLNLTAGGRSIDVRVSTSPTAFGESLVLRLLGRSEVPLELERLGLTSPALAALGRALDRPHGIVLVTGPTGSGKSTTLYAALARLRRPEVKILTVEDPVEVLMDGINQVQVRPEIGLSYAGTLRAFLRQDPDILMIGEIRDRETAEIALRAALTGHLVLSTLHTNSNLGAFTRLSDIGIEPYLAASTVNAVVAQRLIRTLCPDCRAARPITDSEVEMLAAANVTIPEALYDAVGCPTCQGTGYKGRAPLIEVLEIDPDLRAAIRSGEIESLANPVAAADTLAGHGAALVAQGKTTLAEVMRAVQAE